MKITPLYDEILYDSEVEAKIAELLKCYESDENDIPLEVESGWYCGVTGQETTNDELELERIGDHYGDDFPELDTNSICKVKVSSIDIAMEVERQMGDDYGFDNGEIQNPPTDENQIWVYIFRKNVIR